MVELDLQIQQVFSYEFLGETAPNLSELEVSPAYSPLILPLLVASDRLQDIWHLLCCDQHRPGL